jgi:hypothetical protein
MKIRFIQDYNGKYSPPNKWVKKGAEGYFTRAAAKYLIAKGIAKQVKEETKDQPLVVSKTHTDETYTKEIEPLEVTEIVSKIIEPAGQKVATHKSWLSKLFKWLQ